VVRGFFLYGARRAVPPATRLPVAPVLERAERRPISAEAFWHIANWADAAPSSYVRDLRMAGAADPRQDTVFGCRSTRRWTSGGSPDEGRLGTV